MTYEDIQKNKHKTSCYIHDVAAINDMVAASATTTAPSHRRASTSLTAALISSTPSGEFISFHSVHFTISASARPTSVEQ
jgi:hypothetical protein